MEAVVEFFNALSSICWEQLIKLTKWRQDSLFPGRELYPGSPKYKLPNCDGWQECLDLCVTK